VAEQSWEDIEGYVTPYRGRFFSENKTEGSVEWGRGFVYDSTAIMAHQNLSANLHGSLSSPSIRWFEMTFRDQKLAQKRKAAEWLANANEQIYYALQDSNFNLEVNETYQDLVGFGTSALSLEEDGSELVFSSIPLREFVFEPDASGRVIRFYRKLQWTPAQIIAKFGPKDVPDRIIKLDEDGNQSKIEVLWAVYPTNNRIAKIGEQQAPSRRKWQYSYICMDDKEPLGKGGGYYEMPVFVPRWRTTSESAWGNSPSHFAIHDIKTLNRARKIQLIGSEKKIDPPIFAEERTILADLDLSAASLNVVRNVGGIMPFDTKFDIFVSREMIDQLQSAIRNYYFTDQLTFPTPQAQPMTATEAQIRYELMQKLLGPTLGRLQNDLLNPIVSRAFRVLMRNGTIEPPPEIVSEAEAEYDIEYIGALSRAQKSDRAASVERFVVSVGNMAGVMPDMLDVVDQEEVVRQLGRDLGVPPTLMRDKDEVEMMRDEKEAAMMRAQEAALQQAEGDAMNAQQPQLEEPPLI
jgi:hypothetical protein